MMREYEVLKQAYQFFKGFFRIKDKDVNDTDVKRIISKLYQVQSKFHSYFKTKLSLT